MDQYSPKLGVIGLGYVGLPVAVHLSDFFDVVGYDLKSERISQLKDGVDLTREVESEDLKKSSAQFTNEVKDLADVSFFIVAVPTPIDGAKVPNLKPLVSASETVGQVLKKGDIVVYESTVYPGATEEVCLPVLEKVSGLKAGVDFKLAYSPERINPGDKERTFTKITKVVSAQDEDSLEKVSFVYSKAVKAGVYKAASIKVAEAAKVIENTQRDLNIALMNELSQIFDKVGINTLDVLEAAGTKWNFLKFTPGLVGGHCIGVDPYYLTYKANQINFQPNVILSGRKTNDSMPKFVVEKLIKEMVGAGLNFKGASINIYGLTFKEDCPDLRNSKVFEIIKELKGYGLNVNATDPQANAEDLNALEGVSLFDFNEPPEALATIVAVAHKDFKGLSLKDFKGSVLFDVKGLYRGSNDSEIKVLEL